MKLSDIRYLRIVHLKCNFDLSGAHRVAMATLLLKGACCSFGEIYK